MARESARAEETATSPWLTKGPSGDGDDRRMWEPGAGGRRPGGSDRPATVRGCEQTKTRRCATSAKGNVERLIRQSRSREAEM